MFASFNLLIFVSNNLLFQRVLNLLNKIDICNLKLNSRMELTLLTNCHKAALWNLYGHRLAVFLYENSIVFFLIFSKTIRKLCSLHSQLLLNMIPKSNKHKLNTESQCIAMCYLALDFSRSVFISSN